MDDAQSKLTLEHIPISQLQIAPYNPRKITAEAMAKLEKSLTTFGMVDPLIVNKRTGYRVVGGHQRLSVLKKHGITTAPCIVLDIEENREKLLNVALNNQNMAGEYEFGKLADLCLEFDAANLDVSVTGFDDKELARMLTWTPNPENQAKDGSVTTCPKCGHTW